MEFFSRNGALANLLGHWRGKDMVLLLNRGNRGDGLSQLGSRNLFGALGLTWREIYENDLPNARGDVLLVHGASALSRGGSRVFGSMGAVAPRFSHFVLLPATYDLSAPRVQRFVESWTSKFIVFCREMISFDALQSAGARPGSLQLGHDLAFHVDYSRWGSRPALGRAGLFRRDHEAGYRALPRELDICQDASQGSEREPERLLDYVSRFEKIYTDRSHGAIAAAMMGRQVVFYHNNFFKNRAIYEHSLAALPNVRFSDPTPFSLGQFSRAIYWSHMRPVGERVRRAFSWGRQSESPSRA